MRLVAAAKVRRAQQAVLQSRPFYESVQSIIYRLKEKLKFEDLQIPLFEDRPVKTVGLIVISGERGLCGSYNSKIIQMAEKRMKFLEEAGVEVKPIFIGQKAFSYFDKRNIENVGQYNFDGTTMSAETTKKITDSVMAMFYGGEVDKIEIIYNRFVSMLTNEPSIRTLVPLQPTGMENEFDEIF